MQGDESNMATFESNSSSSSISSQRFNLNPSDTSDILVYKVREGCKICSQKELCHTLDQGMSGAQASSLPAADGKADPMGFRCSTVPIPKGRSRIHIQNKDLWSPSERAKWSDMPSARLSIASVGLPRMVYIRRMMGHFQTLYIVSPDHSPASSENTTPESSQHPTPAHTFQVAQEAA